MNLLDLAVVIRAEDKASSAIQRASGNATTSFGSVAKGAAVFTAVQQVASAAFSAIAGSIDSAVARVDTLNAFPKIMQNLGIDSDAASAAIEKLSDGIDGLPTTLDDAASGVTNFVSKNSDIDKSTQYFLAMNDAIIAGAKPTQVQSAAVEQLTQAYAKGRMDMEEWQSISTAMPAQLNQIAAAMGITTEALGEGLRNGTISMDEFMDTMVRLDNEGVDGLASFKQQAYDATGGIAVSFKNMGTALVRAVGNIMDTLNGEQGNISGFFNAIKDGINGLGSFITANIAPITAGIAAIGGAFAALQVGNAVIGLAGSFKTLIGVVSQAGGVLSALGSAIPMLANPVGIAIVAIVALVAAFAALYATSEDFRNAVQPGIDAVKNAFMEFMNVVGPKIQELASVVIPLLQQAFAAALPYIEASWNNLVLIVTTALDIITGAIQFWSALINGDFSAAFDILVSMFTEVWTNIGIIVSNALMLMLQLLGTMLLAMIEVVANWMIGIMQSILDFFANLLASIAEFFASLWASFCEFIANIVAGVAEFIAGVVASISSFVATIISFFLNLFSSVVSLVSQLWNSATSIFAAGVAAVVSFVSNLVSSVVSLFSSLFSSVVSTVSSLVSSVISFFSSLYSSAVGIAYSMWSSVSSAFSSGVSNAVSIVSSLPGQIMGIFSGVGSWLYSSGYSLIQGFVNGVLGAIDWAASSVSGALSSIRAMFPFSPAKKGPFSGRGWTLYSGQAIAESLGEGFADKMVAVTAGIEKQMSDLQSEFDAKSATIGVGYSVSAVQSVQAASAGSERDTETDYTMLVYAIRDAVAPLLSDGFALDIDKREFGRMVRAYG